MSSEEFRNFKLYRSANSIAENENTLSGLKATALLYGEKKNFHDQSVDKLSVDNFKRTDMPKFLLLDPRPIRHTERITDLMKVLFKRTEN